MMFRWERRYIRPPAPDQGHSLIIAGKVPHPSVVASVARDHRDPLREQTFAGACPGWPLC